MRKRNIFILITAILVFVVSFAAAEASKNTTTGPRDAFANWFFPGVSVTKTYEIDEIGVTFEIPSMYDVFTRNMDSNDPLYSKYKDAKSRVQSIFDEESVYLFALNSKGEAELVVCIGDGYYSDLNNVNEAELLEIVKLFKDSNKKNGDITSTCEIYHHPQLTFLKYNWRNLDKTSKSIQYYTVYNDKSLSLSMTSRTGKLSTDQERRILAIVESIRIAIE